MFWVKKDLTILGVIDRELERLHKEMDSILWDSDQTHVDPAYALLVAQIDKLNQHLIELSKKDNL